MKKSLLILAAASSFAVCSLSNAQTIDYGMVGAFVNSPVGTSYVGGGFQLMGITPASGFNPVGVSLSSILNSANMLSVSNSFTTIDPGNPGQFAVGGLAPIWSTGATIANNTQLYILASLSPTFALAEPWALVSATNGATSATDPTWFSPNPTDPFGSTVVELSLAGGQILASSGTSQAFYGASAPGSQFANNDNLNLVPEPSTYALLSLAGLALGGYAARRRLRP